MSVCSVLPSPATRSLLAQPSRLHPQSRLTGNPLGLASSFPLLLSFCNASRQHVHSGYSSGQDRALCSWDFENRSRHQTKKCQKKKKKEVLRN